MDKEQVINQVLALAPEIPGYQVGAYMLELLESIKTRGVLGRKTVLGTGYSIAIPTDMLNVATVYVDGVEIPQTMHGAGIVDESEAETDTFWTDEDGLALADRDYYLICGAADIA